MNKLSKRKAFTLVELLIVIAIIGILFIVLISKVNFATDKSKATGVQTDFRSFQVAFETVSREHAGFNTFGWDTGDLNANGKRDSYDEGDTNKDNIQDPGEIWTGHKVSGETFTKVFTLVKPGTTFETDGYDVDAIAKLETAINANLDPKLHITIGTDGKITMANGAQDPWNKEYHGEYITNAEVDKKDRGAIVMYSDGANNEFGSEHKIANGVVSVSVPGNNKLGKDDYSIAVVYTYVNGYGEVKTSTSGFSQNQEATNNSNNSNNSNNGDNLGDSNNVPAIGDTKQFATLITSSTLKDIYDLSTSSEKEYGQALIAYNDNTYLCIDYFDDVLYDIYYEFYNESEDYWYCFVYATEDLVELEYAPESGWYAIDDYSGELIKCNAPYITFTQDLTIDMPNGLTDILPLFVEHKHNYINCVCECGNANHNYINCQCACGDIHHTYINCTCACGDTTNHNYINCECVVCGDTNHNIQDGFCSNCMSPGLYESGAIDLVAAGDVEAARDMIKMSWDEFLAASIVYVKNGAVYSNYRWQTNENTSSASLDGDLILPNDGSITSISQDGFRGCTSLTSIVIPDSVTSVGDMAFYNCSSLTNITIPDSVTSIGNAAFDSCSSLTSVIIPDSVTLIDECTFRDCTSLTSVTIPHGVTSIGYWAFLNCTSLMSITIPDSVTEIIGDVFEGCSSLQYNEYDNAYYLGNNNNPYVLLIKAKDANITSCNIYGNTKIIYSNAFQNCSRLTNVTIPESVMNICDNAFEYCSSLTSVVIPDSVTSINSGTFRECRSLTSVVIPDSVTSIGNYAFHYCISLTNVIIPDSVTEIGFSAFFECWNLTSIIIPDSVTEIAYDTFCGCESLTNVNIHNNITTIGNRAFSDTGLTSVTIPDSVTYIGDSAFSYCKSLTSITIPNSVTYIGDSAFSSCSRLTSIVIPDSVTRIGKFTFGYCSSLTSIVIPDSVMNIGDSAFSGCTSLTSVTMSDRVTSIGKEAFYNCSGLTSLTIPNSVTSIGNSAFRGCTSLTSIIIPDGVTSISEYALYGCYSLTSITIPESVTRIGKYAFYHSTKLATIIFNGSIEQWNAITKDSNWNGGNGIDIIPKVVCSDGTVVPT